jgi:hypothetical protein
MRAGIRRTLTRHGPRFLSYAGTRGSVLALINVVNMRSKPVRARLAVLPCQGQIVVFESCGS